MGLLSKVIFSLEDYLESIGGTYEVDFKNQVMTGMLTIKVTKGHRSIVGDVHREKLTDERYLIDAIRKLIDDLEKEEV